MKRLAAHLVLYVLEVACALVNHAGGCFCQNHRLHHWALDTAYPPADYPQREPATVECPVCGDMHRPSDAVGWPTTVRRELVGPYPTVEYTYTDTTTSGAGTIVTARWDGQRGMIQ